MTQGREKNIFFPKSPQEFFTHQVDRFGKSFGTFFDLNFVPGHIKAASKGGYRESLPAKSRGLEGRLI